MAHERGAPARRCRSTSPALERVDDLGLRHRLLCRPGRANTGSSASRGCRSRSISPRSSATARRRCRRTGWRCSSRSRARPPTRWPRCATASAAGPAHRCASSTCRPRPSRAKADVVLPTLAGPEIGVASTKAFTCQLAVLRLPGDRRGPRARHARRGRGAAAGRGADRGCRGLMAEALEAGAADRRRWRATSPRPRDVLYLGRGTDAIRWRWKAR